MMRLIASNAAIYSATIGLPSPLSRVDVTKSWKVAFHFLSMSEIEESLKRISAHEGVLGVAILDDSGKLARSAHEIKSICVIRFSSKLHTSGTLFRRTWLRSMGHLFSCCRD
jgi:hypothetical protein